MDQEQDGKQGMCFRGGNQEVFAKPCLSKASDGTEECGRKLKHEVKAEVAGPTVRTIATDPVDSDNKGT